MIPSTPVSVKHVGLINFWQFLDNMVAFVYYKGARYLNWQFLRLEGARAMNAPRGSALYITLIVLVALLFAAQPAYAQSQTHVVQRGETLWSIAARYGTTPQAIVSANGLANANYIYAGQRLQIPVASNGGTSVPGGNYTVRSGDTLSSIAIRFGTTVNAIVQANHLANANLLYAGQRLLIPGGGSTTGGNQSDSSGQVYTVKRGDTLASIAYRFGTTAWAIASANGLANPNYIYPGQRLRISGGNGVAPAPAPAASKRIVVDLSDQHMYVYQNGQMIWNWLVSTGRPGQATIVGHFKVLNKLPNAYAYTWSLQMPYWLGIYWAGSLQNGIHALPIQANGQRLWEGYLGTPVSFGCIILSTEHAQALYNWAPVGTPVDIVW
jgi:LysM repeat protein